MRLYTFEQGNYSSIATEQDGRLVDLARAYDAMKAADAAPEGPPINPIMWVFLRRGEAGLEVARRVLEYVAGGAEQRASRRRRPAPRLTYAFEEVRLLAPVPHPRKVLCCGLNYRGRLEEDPSAVEPEAPSFFPKLANTIIGMGEPIIHPKATEQLDYGVELAAVIGRRGRNIPEGEAMGYVGGYTILHDVSAHDMRPEESRITLGKNFDTFAPIGPCIVTPNELPDPGNLRLRTLLNGEVVQDASTSEWIFPLPRLIASLSGVMTLEPGDIMGTGAPAGTGAFREPPVWLKPGDTATLEIEGIGALENPVVAEP